MPTAKEYYEGVLKTAGVSEAKRQVLMAALDDEEISKALQAEAVAPKLRQDDYSRNMDALKADRQKWEKFYADNLTWKAQEEARIAQLLAGGGNGEDVIRTTGQEFETFKKTWQDELTKSNQQRDAQVVNLLKDGMFLASQHAVEFKEALDTEALAKIAMEKGKSLRDAYADLVAPRRAELQSTQHKEELKRVADEAVRDYAAKHHIPVDTQPREYHPIFDRDPAKQVEYQPNTGRLSPTAERQLRSNFVDTWNEAGAKTSGT